MSNNDNNEEGKRPKELPKIKLLKLKSGDSIVSMVELNDKVDPSTIILYNPFKLIINNELMSDNGRMPVLMEEWLPTQIVLEQVCEIYPEDVITMVDVNQKFIEGYTRSVLKRVQLNELVRRSGSGNPFGPGGILSELSVDESGEVIGDEEEVAEDIEGVVADKIKKLRDEYN